MKTEEGNYNFYYDEAFHDRKLTQRSGKMNIDITNQSYYFVTCTVGFLDEKENKFLKKIISFEEKAKKLLGLSETVEFKGTTLNKKNFKNGIGSFNKNTISIYSDFFELFSEDFIFQLSIINKFEFLVLGLFRGSLFTQEYNNIEALFYNIVKFLDLYADKDMINAIFSKSSTRKIIINLIIKKIDAVCSSFREYETEKKFRKNLLIVREFLIDSYIKVNVKDKYSWDYSWNINCLKDFLLYKDIEIQSVSLYIDCEPNTVSAAEKFDFNKVSSVLSNDSPVIRVSDIFANFFGRLLESINNELKISWRNNQNFGLENSRIILDRSWFCINENQYKLYKQIHQLLLSRISKESDTIYSIMTGDYAESSVILFSLIEYIGGEFISYNKYCEIDDSTHEKDFNIFSVTRLREVLSRLFK